jgi:hypothetical protein
MDNSEKSKAAPDTDPCGPDCACKSGSNSFSRIKAALLATIIIVAGAALGHSLLQKSRSGSNPPADTYSTSLSKAEPSASDENAPKGPGNISFVPLSSFSSLNSVAQQYNGVFVLLFSSDSEKTPAILREINAAKNAIASSRGVQMGLFQLSKDGPDFEASTSQFPTPSILVLIKGMGMQGLRKDDITETKLLQAYMAAMQPKRCCPSGGAGCR